MEKISVVINTLNEEKNLTRALLSVKGFADEILVVDMRSEDRTVEIAAKFGAKIFGHERTGYVEPARNFAISKATGNWIFILDADEEVPRLLAKKLVKEIKNPRADYYRIARKNIIFGKWLKHSRWWPDYNIRFFKQGFVSWNEVIHSVPMTKGNGFDFPAKGIFAISHYHYDTVEQFISRLNRYTTEHARLLLKSGYKFKWEDLIKKPSQEFLSRYFYGQGYKDGVHGLALSLLQSFSEVVMYLKTWQSSEFTQEEIKVDAVITEMRKAEKELHYWQADTLYKKNGNVIMRFRRKFRL